MQKSSFPFRLLLIYGGISGLVIISVMSLMMPITMSKEHFEIGETVGYTTMIIGLSLLFRNARVPG